MTRHLTRRVEGNCIWTWDGSVWAIWRAELPSYPFLSVDAKLALHSRVRDALISLPRQAQLISVTRPRTHRDVAADVAAGVPASAARRWRDHAGPGLRQLTSRHPVERRTYIGAQIRQPRARSMVDSAVGMVSATFGIPGPSPATADRSVVAALSQELGNRLARTLSLEAVAPPEIAWLHRRAVLGGIAPPTPPAASGPGDSRTGSPSATDEDAVLHEGGNSEDPERPRHRRYLRIDTDAGRAYRTTLVISEMPAQFSYPGAGEWFRIADLADFDVDWFARVEAVPNVEARFRARRQHRQLTAQFAEYDGEPTGAPRTLAAALDGIDDQQAALTANPGDPELQVTIGFTLTASTPARLDARAAQLTDLLEPWGYALHRPTGGQVALHQAALPGTPTPAVCGHYVQHLLPRDLAAGVPIAGAAVGDPRGVPIGVEVSGGQVSPVLLDPAFGPATNRSGSLGVFGALGSGKSYFIKRLLLGTVARGGQIITLDRTVAGEYAALADAVPGSATVVRLDETAAIGLDPLGVFGGEVGVRVALGFLTLLTRTTPSDVDGAVLAQAVRRVASAGQPLATVLSALEEDADPEAAGLRRKLASYLDHPLARVVFDPERPPLALDADFICFHAPGLHLPDRDAMVHEHLAKHLLPEQILGQALLYLVAAVSRSLTFSDPDRFGATLIDEAWALTSSPQGRQLLLDSIRDGRKHNAAVWLLSQHPGDLGDDALSHLLGMRVLFRQSRGAAEAALAFLGVPATDDLIELLSSELQTGQCLLRDVRDRVGLVQVLPAAQPGIERALDTTPAPVL